MSDTTWQVNRLAIGRAILDRTTFLLAALILCGLLPLLFLYTIDDSAPVAATSVLLQWVIILWSGLRLSALAGAGEARPIATIFWVYVYVWLGIAGFVQSVSGQSPPSWPIRLDQTTLLVTQLVILAGLSAVELGAQGAGQRGRRDAAHLSRQSVPEMPHAQEPVSVSSRIGAIPPAAPTRTGPVTRSGPTVDTAVASRPSRLDFGGRVVSSRLGVGSQPRSSRLRGLSERTVSGRAILCLCVYAVVTFPFWLHQLGGVQVLLDSREALSAAVYGSGDSKLMGGLIVALSTVPIFIAAYALWLARGGISFAVVSPASCCVCSSESTC